MIVQLLLCSKANRASKIVSWCVVLPAPTRWRRRRLANLIMLHVLHLSWGPACIYSFATAPNSCSMLLRWLFIIEHPVAEVFHPIKNKDTLHIRPYRLCLFLVTPKTRITCCIVNFWFTWTWPCNCNHFPSQTTHFTCIVITKNSSYRALIWPPLIHGAELSHQVIHVHCCGDLFELLTT
jgi:hypothetical protein